MAVTIHTTPPQYSPSDSPVNFVFSSNQTGQANFSFVVETYYNAVKVSEDRVFVEVSNRAHFDVSAIISPLVPAPTLKQSLFQSAGTTGSVYIKVIESYGDPATNQASATSSTVKVIKAVQSDSEYNPGIILSDFKDKKFLTDYPRDYPIEILRETDAFLHFLADSSLQFTIRTFDENGNLIDELSNSSNALIWQFNFRYISNLGSPSSDVYSMEILFSGGETISIKFIDEPCANPIQFLFLNKYGAYDTFVFKHNHEYSGEVDGLGFTRHFGNWNGTAYEYNPVKSGARLARKNITDKGRASTDYLNQDIQNWLVQTLMQSPEVYVVKPGEDAKPVIITGNTYTLKQSQFDDEISEEVEYEYANQNRSLKL